jgi:hypothetical protein
MTTALTVTAADNIDFDYNILPLSDLQVETEINNKTGKEKVKHVLVQGEPIAPSERFWTSLFARYGFNSVFFKYYSHGEVFQRICEKSSNDKMRLCIERGDQGSRLLAVSHPNKPLVSFPELTDMVGRYGGKGLTYNNGVIESTHEPRATQGMDISIGPDKFQHQFLMSCPIDGYGQPNVYLSLLRLICANGMVGYAKTFRSQIALGKGEDNVMPQLVRTLEGFGNDEGYAALRQRFESAQSSAASVYEAISLQKMLYKLHVSKGIDDVGGKALPKGTSIADWAAKGSANLPYIGGDDAVMQAPIFRGFEAMTGNPMRLYGIANMDAMSVKRQRTLPVNCTVYDLLNFTTEVATHYSLPQAARSLNAWVGQTIANEYDMEGTKDKFGDFKDFHLDAESMTAPSVN